MQVLLVGYLVGQASKQRRFGEFSQANFELFSGLKQRDCGG